MGEADDEAAAGASNTRRVRGRFCFRSGPCDGPATGDEGDDIVAPRVLFRFLGLVDVAFEELSISLAFSNADQALASSGDSIGDCKLGRWSRSKGAAFRNMLAAPCLAAISSRRRHCSCSALSAAVSSLCRL